MAQSAFFILKNIYGGKKMENGLKVIDEREIMGKSFRVYGDYENPIFLAKDVAEWIDWIKKKA